MDAHFLIKFWIRTCICATKSGHMNMLLSHLQGVAYKVCVTDSVHEGWLAEMIQRLLEPRLDGQ